MNKNSKKLWYLTLLFAFDVALLILISSVVNSSAMHLGNRSERVMKIQQQLIETGYFDGEPNGFFCFDTRSALKNFQKDYGLKPNGETDFRTLDALNVTSRTSLCFESQTALLALCIQNSNCTTYPEMLCKGLEILKKVDGADTLSHYVAENIPDFFLNKDEPSELSYSAAVQAIRIFSQQSNGLF